MVENVAAKTKSTDELLSELQECEDFTRYYRENEEQFVPGDLAAELERLLVEKRLLKKDVIARSNLSEVYAYQIFGGQKKNPGREKVLCLAVAMGLDLNEVQRLLKVSGYPQLYAKNPWDCMVIYGVCRKMSVLEINELLYDNGRKDLLGS